ncbi:MAG: hypothetical protein AAFO07_13465 [Bacteroidota bacterium]
MTEEFKTKLIANLQWLGEQIGREVEVIDKLSCNKGNYDRHFTGTSRFYFVIEHFGVAFSGAVGRIEGQNVHFEFKTDYINRIERSGNELEMELDLDTKISRLITFKIKEPGDNNMDGAHPSL